MSQFHDSASSGRNDAKKMTSRNARGLALLFLIALDPNGSPRAVSTKHRIISRSSCCSIGVGRLTSCLVWFIVRNRRHFSYIISDAFAKTTPNRNLKWNHHTSFVFVCLLKLVERKKKIKCMTKAECFSWLPGTSCLVRFIIRNRLHFSYLISDAILHQKEMRWWFGHVQTLGNSKVESIRSKRRAPQKKEKNSPAIQYENFDEQKKIKDKHKHCDTREPKLVESFWI